MDDDLTFTRRLMAEQGVRVLPGSFMGVEAEGTNPGSGYVRLALVNDSSTTNEGLPKSGKSL